MRARNRIGGLAGVALTIALAACAQPQPWAKEGVSQDQLQADQRACELAATMEVQKRQQRSAGTMGPAVIGGPSGAAARRFNTSPQGPFADQRGTQLAEEDQLVAECMRDKGYERLKPK